MFHIKSIEAQDINQAYEFTINLFQHHYGTEMKSYLEKDEFERLFNIDFLKGLLLMYTPKNNNNNHNNYKNTNEGIKDKKTTTSRPIGCMIYFIDISPLHGGYGIMLDQFFIISEFRRQGLGHMMMNRLCKEVIAINGSYIKLSYQEGNGLEKFYTDLGFINHSHGQYGLHIFELYGKSQVIDFLHNYESELQGQHEQEQKMSIITFPCHNNQSSSSSQLSTFLPSWCDTSTEVNDLRFPKAQIVTVLSYTKTNNCYELNNTIDSSLQFSGVKCAQDQLHNYKGMCIYVEQCYVCCWLGPMLNFTDFVGDLSILSKRYIWSRVKLWSQLVPELCGFVWEVPCGDVYDIDSLDMDCLKGISLAKQLIQLNITDDTIQEGWNINYLDRKNIEILSGKLSKDFM